MLRSMTGFGRGTVKSSTETICAEIRTLNHRYLDLFIKLPRDLQSLESRIKDQVKRQIHRGRVELVVERTGSDHFISAEINYALAKSYLANLQRLKKKLKLKDVPSLPLLCQMPGVVELRSSPLSIEKIWKEVKKSIDNALRSLLIMRDREGKFLEQDIRKRLGIIKKSQKEIENRLPLILGKYKDDLKLRLAELSGKANSEKLSAEIAILSEKVDLTEELSRFSSHLNQLAIFLNEKSDVGKKINFTIQEMMREINTMSAKANDFPLSQSVVLIKSELEKIKEQIQNIE